MMRCINEGQTAAALVVMIQYEGENGHQLKEGMVYHDKLEFLEHIPGAL